jgi:hypothetical protein
MMRSICAVFTGIVVLALLTFAIEAATTALLTNAFPIALPTEEAMQRNVSRTAVARGSHGRVPGQRAIASHAISLACASTLPSMFR